MHNNGWLGYPLIEASSASVACFCGLGSTANVNGFLSLFTNPTIGAGTFYVDPAEYIQNILYLPFSTSFIASVSNVKKVLFSGATIGNVDTGVDTGCKAFVSKSSRLDCFDLGEFRYSGIYNDFRDFEPYSKCVIYLPYYGEVELPINKIYNKYIQFRLTFATETGEGVYYIGVTNSSLDHSHAPLYTYSDSTSLNPYKTYVDDSNTIIIGKYNVQLGTPIPITSTNLRDVRRNLAMTSLSTLATVGAGAISLSAGLTTYHNYSVTQPSSSHQVRKYTRKNPATNRQQMYRKVTTDTDYSENRRDYYQDRSNYVKQKMIGDVLNGAVSAVNAFNLHANTDKPSNNLAGSIDGMDIRVTVYYVNSREIDSNFNHLYGRPLGTIRKIGSVDGYTEITNLHLEGNEFSHATETELVKISDILSNGFIV